MKNVCKCLYMRILAVILCICMCMYSAGNIAFAEEKTEETNEITSEQTDEKDIVDDVNGGTGERLDGDYAYISAAGMLNDNSTESGVSVRTGTAPWDDNNLPGNDMSELDNVVRSFDMISYTVWFQNKMSIGAPYDTYKEGVVNFEFILPGDSSQIKFETGAMGWLSAKQEAEYEVFENIYNGKTCQILRGSYLWSPSDENPVAIGESYQELTIVIRVLAMQNDETIQPLFTFWMEGNEVNEQGIVTGSNTACSEHGNVEYKTIETPEIKVTAAPRYNLQLKTCESRTKYIDNFDFASGNEYAQNKDVGNIYGRTDVIGAVLQIVGKSPQHGLRGCEIPTGDIEFDIDMKSVYYGNNGEEHDVSQEYAPLLWSIDGNSKDSQQYDGRSISGSFKFASGGAPFNTGTGYSNCFNGGIWTALQENSSLHVKVSDYTVDLENIPYTDANVNSGTYIYYAPDKINNYWDVQTACFSAGEIWLVQPFYKTDGTYVADQYGTGTFNICLNDKNLNMTSVSGQSIYKECTDDNQNQMVKTDDKPVLTMALEQGGVIDQSVTYQQYGKIEYGTALTEGCFENGKDWIILDGKLNIQEMIKHNNAEGRYTAVAYDDLIKFDNDFFVLESVDKGSSAGIENMKWKFLYGAKPDKSGWNHKEYAPSEEGYDEEMMKATADDLIFFTSLEELRENGYICTAVLWEARGLASPQSTNCYIGLKGHVSSSAEPGMVYMVTHSAKAWNKENVQTYAAEYLNKDINELTAEDYIAYAQSDEFPTREGKRECGSYISEYPESFWTNDHNNSDGLKNYIKSWYTESGYGGGSAGVSYGDSCLVVSYAAKIVKDTAQQISIGGSKQAYDMDANQRIADYVLKASALRNAGESTTDGAIIVTDIHISDILPKGLRYIPGSAFIGGTYIQRGEGRQGLIEGGKSFDPDVVNNYDGTQTLEWVIKDAEIKPGGETYFDSVYYSCRIGDISDEQNDVKNNDQLLNRAIIWGENEQKYDFTASNGNLAELSIQVSKNNAVSLSKTADRQTIGCGEDAGFTLNIGNNSDNSIKVAAIDSMPYSGDPAGSSYSGQYMINELKVMTPELLKYLTVYYTCDEEEGKKTGIDVTSDDVIGSLLWEELQTDSNGNADVPDDFRPYAIAVAGVLPGLKTFKMYVNMSFSDTEPGNRIVNRFTNGSLESDAEVNVVSNEEPDAEENSNDPAEDYDQGNNTEDNDDSDLPQYPDTGVDTGCIEAALLLMIAIAGMILHLKISRYGSKKKHMPDKSETVVSR